MDADDLIRRLADVAGGALQEWGRSSAAEDKPEQVNNRNNIELEKIIKNASRSAETIYQLMDATLNAAAGLDISDKEWLSNQQKGSIRASKRHAATLRESLRQLSEIVSPIRTQGAKYFDLNVPLPDYEKLANEGEHIVNEELQHKLAEVYNKVKQIQGGFTHSDPAWLRCQEILDYIKGDNNADS